MMTARPPPPCLLRLNRQIFRPAPPEQQVFPQPECLLMRFQIDIERQVSETGRCCHGTATCELPPHIRETE